MKRALRMSLVVLLSLLCVIVVTPAAFEANAPPITTTGWFAVDIEVVAGSAMLTLSSANIAEAMVNTEMDFTAASNIDMGSAGAWTPRLTASAVRGIDDNVTGIRVANQTGAFGNNFVDQIATHITDHVAVASA